MAQIALPRQQVTQSAGVGSPLYERRRNSNVGPIEMIPNPEFKFPMRDPDEANPSDSASSPAATSTSRARPMSLQAYPTGRRGSAHGPRQKSVSALPEFSFNPASNNSTSTAEQSSTSTVPSPPHSPLATPTTPRPVGGHRRGGSEFIGGDSRAGGLSLLSSSPTKGDGVLPTPNATLRPGPPAGRRGHAHRRSGAISSHDLSSIMNPPTSPRAGSAPVTPSEGNEFKFGHSVNKSMSQPSLRDHNSYAEDSDSSQRPPSRARVGFSDKVEYIRPLSTISSETETSMSTIRGHSATNSLSSVISANASSPQATRVSRSPTLSTVEDERRPSTAGAIMDKFKSDSLMGEAYSRKRPSSAVSPTSPSATTGPASPTVVPTKRRGFFRLDPKSGYHSTPSLHTSASDPMLSVPHDSPLPSPAIDDDEPAEESQKKSSASRKANRKPRKVKSWANSIIPRKGKHSKKKAKAPTPPPEAGPDQDDTDISEDLDFDPNFDEDNTVTIVSPTSSEARSEGDISSWKPRELKRVDSDSCVIDLDAALGPFNTPQGAGPRGQQRGFAAHRRAMHSAGGLLPIHRRTESAPELVPFEFRATTVATPSPMADVFEEEEPEDDTSSAKKQTKPSASESEDVEEIEEPKIQLVEADGANNSSAINWNFNDAFKSTRVEKVRKEVSNEPLSPLDSAQPVSSEQSSRHSQVMSPVEVVEDFEEPRTSSLTHSSDSTVTPQISADESKDQQPMMNMPLPLAQQSLMTPDTITSSFPSPDFRSSQASFDTPRLGTAASSMTDYPVMPSPRFGEPGPDVRISVDDVPSLTSSRSTMTSAMHHGFPMIPPRIPGDRSASLCSVPSDVESRRRKRSSIASLSRLINSSYGEKSKLSIEQRPHSEYLEPAKESKKKHKRLSKLMNFWKPKDSSSSSSSSRT